MSGRGAHRVDVAVIGGGISGLAVGHYLRVARPDARVVVFEAAGRPGGAARTDRVAGYLVDRGPNGFLTNRPDVLELAQSIGLGGELAVASPLARHRFLSDGRRLHALPTSPLSFLRSPLLGAGAKARVALEPFANARPVGVDESVWAFAQRRLGREFARVFIAPMVQGVTAGDARRVSLRSTFPRMAELEDEHGSLLRALFARRQPQPRGGEPAGGPAGPGGRLTSFRGGVGRLVETLAEELEGSLRTGVTVEALERSEGGFRVRLEDGAVVAARRVVLATPAPESARLLDRVRPDAAEALRGVPYVGVRMLALGYRREDVPHPLDGFGYLTLPDSGARLMGCLWSSRVFPEQAPDGRVLLRVLAGGAFRPELVDVPPADLLALAGAELRTLLGIKAAPEMVHDVRYDRAIPQFECGHDARIGALERALAGTPGLFVTGAALRGASLNDCVRSARKAAREVSESLEGAPGVAPLVAAVR